MFLTGQVNKIKVVPYKAYKAGEGMVVVCSRQAGEGEIEVSSSREGSMSGSVFHTGREVGDRRE